MSSATHPLTPDESETGDMPGSPPEDSAKKRSSRACDHCRKTKNKCERPGDALACKSCSTAGTACTFLGATHKRGPPKGYIHALEQRWYLAESILGAILASPDPRAQSIVSTLRQDELAHEVLNKVDIGPFGSTGKAIKSSFPTMEDLFYGDQAVPQPHGPARAHRQSRVSREFVSFVQDSTMTPDQVAQWRDRLAALLGSSPTHSRPSSESQAGSFPSGHVLDSHSGAAPGTPPVQRQRFDDAFYAHDAEPDFNAMYTLDPSPGLKDETSMGTDDALFPGDSDDGTEAFGQLSLDETQEDSVGQVRYHGRASGLHLLGMNERTDDAHEGGIWKFPMVRNWPRSKYPRADEEDDVDVIMPSFEMQDRLLDLYFVHIHPIFPVIYKSKFMTGYNAMKTCRKHPERIPKLLRLVIFSISERIGTEMEKSLNRYNCAEEALKMLNRVYQHSRPTTCEALLLLGIREFAIGSAEHAWLYIGMAIRMAQDLGLNRTADNWQFRGNELFSPVDNVIRKRIWWACCIAEAHICSFMGRPTSFSRGDFDIELPEVNQEEDNETWQPNPSIGGCNPIPSHISSCFRAQSSLSMIISCVIKDVYAVRDITSFSRRASLSQLQSNLAQWYIDLPECLRYDRTALVPPHVLVLHIQYWSTVLLLNRAFLPQNIERLFSSKSNHKSSLHIQCLDACQMSAGLVSTIVNDYRDKFGLEHASPLLIPYVQSAGIMHAATLMLRKSNVQALVGWTQCTTALEKMKLTWPSAEHAWKLLDGVKLGFDTTPSPLSSPSDRPKRRAEHSPERSSDREGHHPSNTQDIRRVGGICSQTNPMDKQAMAEILGVDVPQMEFTHVGPSGSFYPGYGPTTSTPYENNSWASWATSFQSLPSVPLNYKRAADEEPLDVRAAGFQSYVNYNGISLLDLHLDGPGI